MYSLELDHKINTAKARLLNFCAGKRVLCAFSGGKDSQTCHQLLKECGVVQMADAPAPCIMAGTGYSADDAWLEISQEDKQHEKS